jgi:RNA polymerase sigma-70 factor (ECF subfamily)
MGPDTPSNEEITKLLHRWSAGDREAEERLFELVQPELQRLARYYIRGERPGHTLQPSDLLNETYIKLIGAKSVNWQDRRHFYALAARAMRRFLIDYARGKGGQIKLPLDEIASLITSDVPSIELAIAVGHLLEELAKKDPDQCAMVELKYFMGFTDEEAADVLHLPLRTAQRRWLEGRKWLFEQLESQEWKTNR